MNNEHCTIPAALPENPSEFQKLQHMGDMQTYRLCQIQSAQKHLEQLSTELAKESVEAGIMVRNMVRQFRELEMKYLEDSRKALRIQGDKVTPDEIFVAAPYEQTR